MIVEIIPDSGVGRGEPIRLRAHQVVVRLDDGTPVSVSATYGPDKAVANSQAGDDDFNRVLRNLRISGPVICDRIELPKPPPKARLIAGPNPGE